MTAIPGHFWKNLKQELTLWWHERSSMESRSLMEILERRIGARIENISEHIEQIAERYHLYDEPHEKAAEVVKKRQEKIFELNPKNLQPQRIQPPRPKKK